MGARWVEEDGERFVLVEGEFAERLHPRGRGGKWVKALRHFSHQVPAPVGREGVSKVRPGQRMDRVIQGTRMPVLRDHGQGRLEVKSPSGWPVTVRVGQEVEHDKGAASPPRSDKGIGSEAEWVGREVSQGRSFGSASAKVKAIYPHSSGDPEKAKIGLELSDGAEVKVGWGRLGDILAGKKPLPAAPRSSDRFPAGVAPHVGDRVRLPDGKVGEVVARPDTSVVDPPDAAKVRVRVGGQERLVPLGSLSPAPKGAASPSRDRETLKRALMDRAGKMSEMEFAVTRREYERQGGWWPGALSDWETPRGRALAAEMKKHRSGAASPPRAHVSEDGLFGVKRDGSTVHAWESPDGWRVGYRPKGHVGVSAAYSTVPSREAAIRAVRGEVMGGAASPPRGPIPRQATGRLRVLAGRLQQLQGSLNRVEDVLKRGDYTHPEDVRRFTEHRDGLQRSVKAARKALRDAGGVLPGGAASPPRSPEGPRDLTDDERSQLHSNARAIREKALEYGSLGPNTALDLAARRLGLTLTSEQLDREMARFRD